jgi:hypothetical protein
MRTRSIAPLLAVLALPAAAGAQVTGPAPAPAPQVGGRVTEAPHQRLPGMQVEALPEDAAACTSEAGCVSTYSGPDGAYTLSGLAPGSYAIDVLDGSSTLTVSHVQIAAGAAELTRPLRLGRAAVPATTRARAAVRDLRWLNGERSRNGLPAGVVQNPRWSQECAAHDDYEAANGVLQSTENPVAPGASLGGAWAGRAGVLAQGRWTQSATPWENAPVNLLALLAPSLSVTGIDDSGTLQCAITSPGMLRPPPAGDALTTVPGPGATGVPGSELARETPFTPVQFAGLPVDRPTGRELFVYLNRAGALGQAPVRITGATLQGGGGPVAVRVVDSSTRTIGPYLAGGILIPVLPLAPATRYRATVSVQDGAGTLRRAWSFTTR